MSASILRRLAALKLEPSSMSEVLSIIADIEAANEDRRAKDRDRKRAVRGKSTECPQNVQGNGADIPAAPSPSFPSSSSPPTPPLTTTTLPTPSEKTPRARRLPDDWQPRPEDCTPVARQELPKFRDYWRAKAGRDGMKLDWDATWRNWQRNARPARDGPNGQGRRADPYSQIHNELHGIGGNYESDHDTKGEWGAGSFDLAAGDFHQIG